jgi:hypothetical protein
MKRLALIEWVDIESRVGWIEEDPEDINPPSFTCVGYIIYEDSDKVVTTDTLECTGNVTVYPQGCITDITYLS